jgi:hypothetical protein
LITNLLALRRSAEAREPVLDDVQREQFLRATAFFSHAVLQIEVCAAGLRCANQPR